MQGEKNDYIGSGFLYLEALVGPASVFLGALVGSGSGYLDSWGWDPDILIKRMIVILLI